MKKMGVLLVILLGFLMQGCAGLASEPTVIPTQPVKTRVLDLVLPVEVDRDIQYTNIKALDVFYPKEEGLWPVIVILHGLDGDKGQYESGARIMAEGGAVVYNANWRSVPWEAGELAMMEDSACAVRYARATATDYGGDPDRVVLFGHSIGGWSGAVIALSGDDFEGDCKVSGFSAMPDAFVGYGGAYDAGESNPDGGASYLKEENPELWNKIYPYALIDRNSGTDFHLLVGELDETFNPVAERFYDALKQAGYEVSLTVVEGGNHEGGDEIVLGRIFQNILDAAYDLPGE